MFQVFPFTSILFYLALHLSILFRNLKNFNCFLYIPFYLPYSPNLPLHFVFSASLYNYLFRFPSICIVFYFFYSILSVKLQNVKNENGTLHEMHVEVTYSRTDWQTINLPIQIHMHENWHSSTLIASLNIIFCVITNIWLSTFDLVGK